MNLVKRACLSLWHNWWKNLLVVLLFTALFAVAVGSLTLYGTTKAQTDHLQKALGNAVTLKGVSFSFRGDGGGFRMVASMLSPEVVETFVTGPEVEAYNFADYTMVKFPEAGGVYQELWEEAEYQSFDQYTVMGYTPMDTSLDQAFTVYGFRLEEGEHLTRETYQLQACLVSRQFAERNGLAVGDSVQMQLSIPGENDRPVVSPKIMGIFSAPDSETLKDTGWRPEDMLFLTPAVFCGLSGITESDGLYSMWSSRFATAYLKSPEDVDAFVEEAQKKLEVRQVLDSNFTRLTREPIPEEFADMEGMEAMEYLEAHPQYDLILDREWYGMVGKPLERVRDLAGVIAVVMLAAILLVLALVSALLVKGRKLEMGSLLAMGEARGRVAAQMAIEVFLPLLMALGLGLLTGITVGGPVVENLCNGVYEQSAALRQGENDLVTYAHTTRNKFSLDVYHGGYAHSLLERVGDRVMVYPKAEARLNGWSLAAYLLAALGTALLAILIQAVSVLRLNPARILTGKR